MSDGKFDAHFRGSTDVVKARLAQYLPDVEHLTASNSTLVDLGCGRGEWLELCREREIYAIGVDQNQEIVGDLAAHGHSAVCSPVLTYLQSLADSSVDCVTAFHLLEHFTLDDLRSLLVQIQRVLRPLHPEVLSYMLKNSGFESIELRYLNPVSTEIQTTRNPHVTELLHAYFGPQDLGFRANVPKQTLAF